MSPPHLPLASIEAARPVFLIVMGIFLMISGTTFGLLKWFLNPANPATAGTVMLAALPIMLGLQLVLAFLMWDMQSVPRIPIYPRLPDQPDVVTTHFEIAGESGE